MHMVAIHRRSRVPRDNSAMRGSPKEKNGALLSPMGRALAIALGTPVEGFSVVFLLPLGRSSTVIEFDTGSILRIGGFRLPCPGSATLSHTSGSAGQETKSRYRMHDRRWFLKSLAAVLPPYMARQINAVLPTFLFLCAVGNYDNQPLIGRR
jgi:hypothetical protein